MIRERFDHGFQWQSSCTALSVSDSKRQRVCEYNANQEPRHKRADFDSEYVFLLKRNEIRYGLDRLWGSEGWWAQPRDASSERESWARIGESSLRAVEIG